MSPMRRVIFILTVRCDDSARLQSQAMDGELLVYERIALRMHLVSCRNCNRYRRFLRVFRSVMRSVLEEELGTDRMVEDAPTLSAGAKSKIKSSIERAQGG